MDHVQLRYAGERVLLVAHQVIVLCLRYILEELDEEQILAIDKGGDIANCSVTSFAREEAAGRETMVLKAYNFVAPLTQRGAPVTAEKDPAVAT